MPSQAGGGNARLFVAMFPKPQELPAELHFLEKGNGVIPKENQHVTVLFVGNFPEARLDEAMDILQSTARKHPRFKLEFDNFCVRSKKPDKGHLWALYCPHPELQRIHDVLAKTLGSQEVGRKVLPHVTLSRLGGEEFRRTQTTVDGLDKHGPDLHFDHLSMARSTLTPSGSVYAKLCVESLAKEKP